MESLRVCSGWQMLWVYLHKFGSTDVEVDIKPN